MSLAGMPPRGWRPYAGALVACGISLVALGAILLHPYVTSDFRYPLGWDAMLYVWRAGAAGVDGLDRIGAVRAGFPLLVAVLRPVIGQNEFTLVAVLPAVLAGLAGLGAAGMVRAAFGMPAGWIPVVGVLAWTAFGTNEIPLHHLDNLLNAAAVLAGFAAALAFVGKGQGALAAGLLFAAAGVAHWPFHVVAMAVFLGALVALARWEEGAGFPARSLATGPVGRLVGAAAASVGLVGLTLLVLPATGWLGARPGPLGELLKERVFARFDDPQRFVALPGAAIGAAVLIRRPPLESSRAGRRLFLSIVAVWTIVTVGAILAQAAGVPTAGARVLSFYFPLSILPGVLLWWLWGAASRRASGSGPVTATRVAAAALVVVTLAVFGALFWTSWSRRHPWVEADAVRQVAAAGAYVERYAAGRDVVYPIDTRSRSDLATLGRWWLVVKASLPPGQVPLAHRYVGSPRDYLERVPSAKLGAGLPPGESDDPDASLWGRPGRPEPAVVVIERYNRPGFEAATAADPSGVIAPGVLILRGPLPPGPLPPVAAPTAHTSGRTLAWTAAVAAVVLFGAGLGWALTLLPADPVLRTVLAPALGAAAVTLAALLWGLVGLPFSGWSSAGPLVVATALGWGLTLMRRRASLRVSGARREGPSGVGSSDT